MSKEEIEKQIIATGFATWAGDNYTFIEKYQMWVSKWALDTKERQTTLAIYKKYLAVLDKINGVSAKTEA